MNHFSWGWRVARLLLFAQNKILGLICRLLFKPFRSDFEPTRILIFRTCALGDFILATPAIVALRKRFPYAKIVFLTTSSTNSIIQESVRRYVGSSRSFPWLRLLVPKVIDDAICFYSLSPLSLIRKIRPQIMAFNPDITFILAHPGESGMALLKKLVFLRLLGVRKATYGWRARLIGNHLRKSQHEAGMFEHQVMGPLRSVTELPLMPPIREIQIDFSLSVDSSAEHWVNELWRQRGLDLSVVVAIVPGSSQPHKRWPVERFQILCEKLSRNYRLVFVVVGTVGEENLGDRIGEDSDFEVVNLVGKTSIVQAAALFRRCALVVGNDGGAMHLASAMSRPCVSLISGIEYAGSVEPWNSRKRAVRHAVPCAPCYSFTQCPLGHGKCMTELPIESVLLQCTNVLDELVGDRMY